MKKFLLGLVILSSSNFSFSSSLELVQDCRSLLSSFSREELTLFRYSALYGHKIVFARQKLKEFKPYRSLEEALSAMPFDSSKFFDIQSLSGDGVGFLHLFSAKVGAPSDKVFVKIPNVTNPLSPSFSLGTRNSVDVLNEINWARYLSSIGMGPRFYGVYESSDGRVALVYDFFEGEHFSRSKTFAFHNPRAKEKALQTLREMREVFSALSVDVHDLQFRIDQAGNVKIIDAEFFDIVNSGPTKKLGYQPNFSLSESLIDTRKVFDLYISKLEKAK
jgi:hypothetical protein